MTEDGVPFRIQVDFNSLNEAGDQVPINIWIKPDLLDVLFVGQRVILYQDAHDFEVEATVIKQLIHGKVWWLAVVDWAIIQYADKS
jgi:hypothetical protein